jgi:hypothetical protein
VLPAANRADRGDLRPFQNVAVDVGVGVFLPGAGNAVPLASDTSGWFPSIYDSVAVPGEIAIVEPSTRKVVEIISTSG